MAIDVLKLHPGAELLAESTFDQLMADLQRQPVLARLTAFYTIRKALQFLDAAGDTPEEEYVPTGHEMVSWVLSEAMRMRKAQPKKEKIKHEFEPD